MPPPRRLPEGAKELSFLAYVRTFTSLHELVSVQQDPDWADYTTQPIFLPSVPWLAIYLKAPTNTLRDYFNEVEKCEAAGNAEAKCITGVRDLFIRQNVSRGLSRLFAAIGGGLPEALFFSGLYDVFSALKRGCLQKEHYMPGLNKMINDQAVRSIGVWKAQTMLFVRIVHTFLDEVADQEGILALIDEVFVHICTDALCQKASSYDLPPNFIVVPEQNMMVCSVQCLALFGADVALRTAFTTPIEEEFELDPEVSSAASDSTPPTD